MRNGVIILLLFGMLAIQTPILSLLGLSNYSANLGVITVMFLAGTASGLGGFVASIIAGVLVDAFTPGGLLGMHMETLGIGYLLAVGLSRRVDLMRPLPLMVVSFVLCLTDTLLFYIFSIIFDREFSQHAAVLMWSIPHAMLTALMAPILFYLLGLIDNRMRGRRKMGPLLGR